MNTIVRGRGFSTDAAILEQVTKLSQAGDRGGRRRGGGVSRMRCRRRASSPGAASGRRTCADADLVIHATSVRDEVLFELGEGQTLVDLPYPRTATAEAAAAAGARVLDGLEVLVAQGAASFELWTGVRRPWPRCAARVGLT